MNRKRLIPGVIAAVLTTIIIIAIIVGCMPRWGNGSAMPSAKDTAQSSSATSQAQRISVTLPSYYAENMVFQRGKPLVIQGTATAANDDSGSDAIDQSKLSATLTQGKTTVSAAVTVRNSGAFTCTMKSLQGGLKPYRLTIAYNGETVFSLAKVYVGDVFVAAGQSNMELNYTQYYSSGGNTNWNWGGGLISRNDLPKLLTDKNVHFVVAEHSVDNTDFPLIDANKTSGWLTADSTNSQHLSYLAQQFAMQLRAKRTNIPIGIIQTSWGGTAISRHVQGGDIYANHIAPLTGFRVAAVLWYQGCDDAAALSTSLDYESQMTALINQYRKVFDESTLPFLYVQLARWSGYQYTQNVRQGQLRTLDNANLRNSANVAMTVSIDTDKGTSKVIHPLGKDILGARMAAQYEAMVAGESVPSGPIIESATRSADKSAITLSFKDGTADKLRSMKPNYSESATASAPDYTKTPNATPLDGIANVASPTDDALQGFEVADNSGNWTSATATIKGNQVSLTSTTAAMADMTQVRYLWSGNPDCSSILYNGDTLPASPFTVAVRN